MKRKAALLWALTILYTCVIFSFSLMPGHESAGLSGRIAAFIMDTLHLSVSFEGLHHLIRKLAHFSEYGILGIFAYHAAKSSLPADKVMPVILLYGIAAAGIDETIQLFIPQRAGAITDVMIDDKPENLVTIAKKHAVIACPMPWNRTLVAQGFVMAKDWTDIYDIITRSNL